MATLGVPQRKAFKIERVGNNTRLQINNANFWLDVHEKSRLAICFNKAMDIEGMPFPVTGHATYITYENGIIAAIVTVAKLRKEADEFLFTIMYQVPSSSEYAVDTFYADRNVMDGFLTQLTSDFENSSNAVNTEDMKK